MRSATKANNCWIPAYGCLQSTRLPRLVPLAPSTNNFNNSFIIHSVRLICTKVVETVKATSMGNHWENAVNQHYQFRTTPRFPQNWHSLKRNMKWPWYFPSLTSISRELLPSFPSRSLSLLVLWCCLSVPFTCSGAILSHVCPILPLWFVIIEEWLRFRLIHLLWLDSNLFDVLFFGQQNKERINRTPFLTECISSLWNILDFRMQSIQYRLNKNWEESLPELLYF